MAVVRYLREEFGFEREDAQCDDNNALSMSCRFGHLEVVKYLREEFGRVSDDNYALWWRCKNGHVKVVKLIKEEIGLEREDAQSGAVRGDIWMW